MNAERLHTIVKALHQEITETDSVGKMQQLVNSLQQVINHPHPQHQQVLAAALKSIYAALSNVPSDGFSPGWREILNELSGADLVGERLRKDIESILARNQITPAVALEELQSLQRRLNLFKTALDQITAAFDHLGIGDERLEDGRCEISLLIPRATVDNKMLEFARELKEIGFILNTLSEVSTGQRDELQIRTISSSELLVHLQAAVPFAVCVAVSIERIVALYKQVLEIRKIKQELKKNGVPKDVLTPLEKHANEAMGDGIDKASIEIVTEFYKKDDQGRRNELENAVRISLRKLANRIDKGVNIEVRVGELPSPMKGEEENTDLVAAVSRIHAAKENMQYLRLDGVPILHLSEGQGQPSDKSDKKKD